MKITFAVLPVLLPFVLDAQLTPTAVNADAIVLVPYRVVAAGPHERVWQSVTVDAEGNTNANSYTELATGLNYQNTTTGKWEESREAFEITKDGRAVANHGQHQVILAGDINTGGSVDLLMPDGQRLLSNPMGLSFRDASGKSVLIAEVTNCVGELVEPNVVLYVNAFDTLNGAVRYTYTKSGFSQDIILYQNPGSPADYGLDPATTVLEMYSEFFDPPAATVSFHADNDQLLNFGQMQIGRGAAYLLDEESLKGIPVTKEWTTIDQRRRDF